MWAAGDGSFNTATNWSPPTVPLGSYDVSFINDSPVVTLQPANPHAFGSSDTLTINGASPTLTTASNQPVQKYNLTQYVNVGVTAGSPASLTLTHADLSSQLVQLGTVAGSNGAIIVNGSTSELEASRVAVAVGGNSSDPQAFALLRAINGGIVRVSDALMIGGLPDSNNSPHNAYGQVVIDGLSHDEQHASTLLASEDNRATEVVVGATGQGDLHIVNGATGTIKGSLFDGFNRGTGVVDVLHSSNLAVTAVGNASRFELGWYSSGTLTVSDDSTLTSNVPLDMGVDVGTALLIIDQNSSFVDPAGATLSSEGSQTATATMQIQDGSTVDLSAQPGTEWDPTILAAYGGYALLEVGSATGAGTLKVDPPSTGSTLPSIEIGNSVSGTENAQLDLESNPSASAATLDVGALGVVEAGSIAIFPGGTLRGGRSQDLSPSTTVNLVGNSGQGHAGDGQVVVRGGTIEPSAGGPAGVSITPVFATMSINGSLVMLPDSSPTVPLQQNPSSTLIEDLGPGANGGLGTSDLLDVTGTALLGGTLDVKCPTPADSSNYVVGDTFHILHAVRGISGSFSNLHVERSATSGGITYEIVYDHNDVYLRVVNGSRQVDNTLSAPLAPIVATSVANAAVGADPANGWPFEQLTNVKLQTFNGGSATQVLFYEDNSFLGAVNTPIASSFGIDVDTTNPNFGNGNHDFSAQFEYADGSIGPISPPTTVEFNPPTITAFTAVENSDGTFTLSATATGASSVTFYQDLGGGNGAGNCPREFPQDVGVAVPYQLGSADASGGTATLSMVVVQSGTPLDFYAVANSDATTDGPTPVEASISSPPVYYSFSMDLPTIGSFTAPYDRYTPGDPNTPGDFIPLTARDVTSNDGVVADVNFASDTSGVSVLGASTFDPRNWFNYSVVPADFSGPIQFGADASTDEEAFNNGPVATKLALPITPDANATLFGFTVSPSSVGQAYVNLTADVGGDATQVDFYASASSVFTGSQPLGSSSSDTNWTLPNVLIPASLRNGTVYFFARAYDSNYNPADLNSTHKTDPIAVKIDPGTITQFQAVPNGNGLVTVTASGFLDFNASAPVQTVTFSGAGISSPVTVPVSSGSATYTINLNGYYGAQTFSAQANFSGGNGPPATTISPAPLILSLTANTRSSNSATGETPKLTLVADLGHLNPQNVEFYRASVDVDFVSPSQSGLTDLGPGTPDPELGPATLDPDHRWGLTADTSGLTPGLYTFFAVATDGNGLNSMAAKLTVGPNSIGGFQVAYDPFIDSAQLPIRATSSSVVDLSSQVETVSYFEDPVNGSPAGHFGSNLFDPQFQYAPVGNAPPYPSRNPLNDEWAVNETLIQSPPPNDRDLPNILNGRASFFANAAPLSGSTVATFAVAHPDFLAPTIGSVTVSLSNNNTNFTLTANDVQVTDLNDPVQQVAFYKSDTGLFANATLVGTASNGNWSIDTTAVNTKTAFFAVATDILSQYSNIAATSVNNDTGVFWDPNSTDGIALGGTGSWATAVDQLDWYDPFTGQDEVWSNAANNLAVFMGTPGVVIIDPAIQANIVQVSSVGYQFSVPAGPTVTLGALVLDAPIDATTNVSGLTKVDNGTLEFDAAPTLGDNHSTSTSSLEVGAGSLKFNVNSGSATIGTGVTVQIDDGATLDLTGSVSAFSGQNLVDLTVAGNGNVNTTGVTEKFGALVVDGTYTLTKTGSATLEFDDVPTLGDDSMLHVSAGALLFDATSGMATVGAGVVAQIDFGATLEMDGTVSALSSDTNTVNVTDNGTLLARGTNQKVGFVNGTGIVWVNIDQNGRPTSDLSASGVIANQITLGGNQNQHCYLIIVDPSPLYWDPTGSNGAHLGGDGVWTTDSTQRVWYDPSIRTDVAWNNANNDQPIFTGTAGTVTIDPAVFSNTLEVSSSGYRLLVNPSDRVMFDALTLDFGASLAFGSGSASTGMLEFRAAPTLGVGSALEVDNGTLEFDAAPKLHNYSSLIVNGGRLRFNVYSGTPAIGTGVTATVGAGGILELAGSVAALSSAGNRVNVINNNRAGTGGLLVSGTNQQLGTVDGTGDIVVNAGSDLTADYLRQHLLTIHGATSSGGLVRIRGSVDPIPHDTAHTSVFESIAIDNDGAPLGTRTYYGTLDLMNNDMILSPDSQNESAALATYQAINDMVRFGADWGGWDGNGNMVGGILSSSASNDAYNVNGATGIGVMLNDAGVFGDPGNPLWGSSSSDYGEAWDGFSNLSQFDTLVKFTFIGDCDLEGQISTWDVNNVEANLGTYPTVNAWSAGDFYYQGEVTQIDAFQVFADLTVQNDYQQGPAIATLTETPDPTTGLNLTLTANNVADFRQVMSVSFYQVGPNGNFASSTLIGTVTDGSAGWSLAGINAANFTGSQTFFAVATDDNGATSTPVSMTYSRPSLYWDSDGNPDNNNVTTGAGLGGSGTWTTDPAAKRWYDPQTGTDVAWNNSVNEDAVFEGSAGVVNLATGITADSISFTRRGYTIQGGSLTIVGAGSIYVASGFQMLDTIASPVTIGSQGQLVKTGGGVLELDAAPTLGDSSSITVSAGTLRFNVASGSASIGSGVTATITSGATLELKGPVSALSCGSGSSEHLVSIANNSVATAGGLLVSGMNQQVGTIDGTGNVVVNAGSDLTTSHIRQNKLTIHGTASQTGKVVIRGSLTPTAHSNSQTSMLNSLAINNDGGAIGSRVYYGQLDVMNQDMIVQSTDEASAEAAYSAINDMARGGLGANGDYTGNGIASSTASWDLYNGDGLTAVGVILNDDGSHTNSDGSGAAIHSTFDGVTVNQYAVLIKYTFMGDTTLNGYVTGGDVVTVSNNVGVSGGGWVSGDFAYQGTVNGFDVGTVEAAYYAQNDYPGPL